MQQLQKNSFCSASGLETVERLSLILPQEHKSHIVILFTEAFFFYFLTSTNCLFME